MSTASRLWYEAAQSPHASGLAALLPYVARYRWYAALAVAALAVASASLLAVPHLVGRLVDELAGPPSGTSESSLRFWLLISVALYAFCTTARAYFVNWIGERVIADLRVRAYEHLLSLPVRFFATRPTGELLSRVSNDITALQVVISIVIVIGLRSVVQLAGALGMLVLTNWKLGLMALAVAPLVAGAARVLGRRIRARSVVNRDREAEVATQLEESINGIETLKAFGMEALERERFSQRVEISFASTKELLRSRSQTLLCVAVLLLVAIGVLGAVALQQLAADELSAGALAQFTLYLSVATFAVLGLGDIHGELRKAAGATDRLFALFEQEPEGSRAALALPPQGRGRLEVLDVSYCYPARPETPALIDVRISVEPGEIVALTGPSGAGKTTLLRLLLRFDAPENGTIVLDGVDVARLSPFALRGAIAIVPQEPVIFTGSAMENIRAGNTPATEARVVEAARLAQAHEFISALPHGYHTSLGSKGHELSAGQRQRIAIARAVLRRPRILLLDEATSHLDVESEALLTRALLPFLRERTTLLISHRAALVAQADRVVVFDQGRIVAQGTHAVLAGASTFYCNLMD